METKFEAFAQFLREEVRYEETSQDFLDKTAPLIGYIVHSFNRLEIALDDLICQFISSKADLFGAAAICGMSYSQKTELFSRLIREKERHIGSLKITADFIAGLKDAGTLRNLVVHTEYENSKDGYFYSNLKSKKGELRELHVQVTVKGLIEIKEFIDSIWEMIDDFEEQNEELHRLS
jgi:hypothetical protein